MTNKGYVELDNSIGKWYVYYDGEEKQYLSCGMKINYYVGDGLWFTGTIEHKPEYGGYVIKSNEYKDFIPLTVIRKIEIIKG